MHTAETFFNIGNLDNENLIKLIRIYQAKKVTFQNNILKCINIRLLRIKTP